MKKLLAIALVLTMLLSLSVVAFAADGPLVVNGDPINIGSQSGGSSTDNTPSEVYVVPAVNTIKGKTISEADMTDAQRAQADKALAAAEAEGYSPVEAIVVEVPEDVSEDNPAEVPVTVASNQIIVVVGPDGSIIRTYTAQQVDELGGHITVPGNCTIVICNVQ